MSYFPHFLALKVSEVPGAVVCHIIAQYVHCMLFIIRFHDKPTIEIISTIM